MLQFVNSINQKIEEEKLIRAEKNFLALVSGGQDSMCLVLILYLLKNQIEFEFDLIWMNHFWQKSSFFTMLHISRLSRSFSSRALFWLAFTETLSEQRARDWRHSATQRTHAFYQYNICAQGHTKSDRIETVLFNLVRGAGLSGVSALHWTDNQTYFCQNNFYPLFAHLFNQTHLHTTRAAPAYPTAQLNCIEVADMGFATTYPNCCRNSNHCYAIMPDTSSGHNSSIHAQTSSRKIQQSKRRRAQTRKEAIQKFTCLLENTSQLTSVCSAAKTALLYKRDVLPERTSLPVRVEQVLEGRSHRLEPIESTQYYYYQLKRISLGIAKRER